jgi:hypothetical protein
MIFISHSNQDADFVSELRQQLESFGLKTWVDCRELTAGQKLAQEIEQAIDDSSHLIAVISPQTVNSKWVRLAKQQHDNAFKIIPLLLTGITPAALGAWFDDEPLAVTLEIKPVGLLEALPQILAALGVQAPDKIEKIIELKEEPLKELILEDVGFLAEGKQGGRLRRRLPNYNEFEGFDVLLHKIPVGCAVCFGNPTKPESIPNPYTPRFCWVGSTTELMMETSSPATTVQYKPHQIRMKRTRHYQRNSQLRGLFEIACSVHTTSWLMLKNCVEIH